MAINVGKAQAMVTEELEAQLRAGGTIVYLAEELDDRMVREYPDGRREFVGLGCPSPRCSSAGRPNSAAGAAAKTLR